MRQFLAAAVAALALQACNDSQPPGAAGQVRFATFNIAMGLEGQGEMALALKSGEDQRLRAVAAILQLIRPQVVLLNEFDFDPDVDAAELFNRNYLRVAAGGGRPIDYPYSFRAAVNTGVDSGLDLDGNGILGEPADAWGFGRFPGQYGMLILSRLPIKVEKVRTFQTLRWAEIPDARRPFEAGGAPFHPDAIWKALRLSSKSHWDVPLLARGRIIHLLASHPTPPVFDGAEDRNGKRNHDEIAFWVRYVAEPAAAWIVDDQGAPGGLAAGSAFVIAGDLNADPADGDSLPAAIGQLLQHPAINAACTPRSEGGAETAFVQGGVNLRQRGEAAADTADFNDEAAGNLRLDYLLPSRGLEVRGCGVFWPALNKAGHGLVRFSDHRLVWMDLGL